MMVYRNPEIMKKISTDFVKLRFPDKHREFIDQICDWHKFLNS